MSSIVHVAMGTCKWLVGMVLFYSIAEASVISKSSKEECIAENDVKSGNNNLTCSTKLVVALTISADEVRD